MRKKKHEKNFHKNFEISKKTQLLCVFWWHIWNILEKWDQKYKKINKYFKNTYKYKKEEIHLEDAEKLRILFC